MTVKGTLGHVLLVDDDEAFRRAVMRQLKLEGWSVVDAPDGRRALHEMGGGRFFDCVVSDVNMPDLDGFGLIAEIRRLDDDLPVLLMTGDPSLDGAVRALDSGAVSYLSKPFDQETLATAVARAARQHGLARMRRRAEMFASQVLEPEQAELAARFQSALDRSWMAYQPIVDVVARRVFAFEALIRTDEQSMKRPDVLIAAAERLGRIHDLGRTVRAHVAAAAPSAPKDALLFVNVHGLELTDEQLYAPSAPLTQLSHRVVIEITERVGLDTMSGATRAADLRKLGYKIAVDDLGAGYAALGALASLEPEIVKLDMSLIRDLARSTTKRRVVAAISVLVRELGGRVVAEGVETVEEREAVLDAGITLMQGWLFARPAREFVVPELPPL
jgi:EAL domain-containing protein (putative c-di-GMP-specific phosphodiesterase class I)/CheY-like chemotaxis protein